jgi:hypothetical protein
MGLKLACAAADTGIDVASCSAMSKLSVTVSPLNSKEIVMAAASMLALWCVMMSHPSRSLKGQCSSE